LTALAYVPALIFLIFTGFQNKTLKNFLLFKYVRDNWNFTEIKGPQSSREAPENPTEGPNLEPEPTPESEVEPEPESEPVIAPDKGEADPEIEAWKGELTGFVSKLERYSDGVEGLTDKVSRWPEPRLQQLKDFLGDITTREATQRFCVTIPTNVGSYHTDTITVSPLIGFLNFASENPDQFDSALETLKLALDAKPLATFDSDYSKHFEVLNGAAYRSETMILFSQHPLPLHEKLDAAFKKIFESERAILTSGVNQTFRAEESRRGAPIHDAYVAAVNELKNSVATLLFHNCIPTTEYDLINAYNSVLETLVGKINQRFKAYSYGEIDFDTIKIPLPEADVSSSHLTQSVTTISQETLFPQIKSASEFASRFDISSMPKHFVAILNAHLAKRFSGIRLCGAGVASTLFYAGLQGKGTRVLRKIGTNEEESMAFLRAMFGHIFERETQQNPNLGGRTTAATEIGQLMARFGGERPTVDAEVLTDPTTGERYICTTDAGDQSLIQWRNGVTAFTGANIDRFTQLQAFSYITGQCDGHAGNFVVNSQTGQITAIDPGFTFPPFEFGETADELRQHLAQNLHDYDDHWGRLSVDTIMKDRGFNAIKMPKSIILTLPTHMTRKTFDMLTQMVNDEACDEIDKTLKATGHTEKERQATQWRLRTMRKQLATVQITSEEELQRLWNTNPSPFTGDNCWLRRFPV
jgi:hypothetical protein